MRKLKINSFIGAISKRDCLTNVSMEREKNILLNLNIFGSSDI